VKQINCDFIFRMSESAHLSIFTAFHIIRVGLTKLTFILFRMVKLFNSIMSFQTILSVMNALVVSCTACNIGTHFTCVGP
jgi:hypothetical protein